jgi:hypothetical protein
VCVKVIRSCPIRLRQECEYCVRIWQRTQHIQSCSWRGCDSPPSLLRALSPRCSQIDFTTRFGSAPMACASHPQLTQHLLTLTLTLTLTHVPTSHNTYSRSLTYPPTHSLVHTNISNCALYPLLFLATYLLSVPRQTAPLFCPSNFFPL